MAKKRRQIEQTYNPEEVADYCRVSRRTVYRWLSDGTLLASKAGPRTWVITQTQLNAFLTKPEGKKPKEAKPVEKQPEEAKPIQPELPEEMLPTGPTGPEKYAPVGLYEMLGSNEPSIHKVRAGVQMITARNRSRQEQPEETAKPETSETWRGKKRPKGAK